MNDLLKIHAPYQKAKNCKLEFKEKAWIGFSIQKSISIKRSTDKRRITSKI